MGKTAHVDHPKTDYFDHLKTADISKKYKLTD